VSAPEAVSETTVRAEAASSAAQAPPATQQALAFVSEPRFENPSMAPLEGRLPAQTTPSDPVEPITAASAPLEALPVPVPVAVEAAAVSASLPVEVPAAQVSPAAVPTEGSAVPGSAAISAPLTASESTTDSGLVLIETRHAAPLPEAVAPDSPRRRRVVRERPSGARADEPLKQVETQSEGTQDRAN
jgi:hypothetical protein